MHGFRFRAFGRNKAHHELERNLLLLLLLLSLLLLLILLLLRLLLFYCPVFLAGLESMTSAADLSSLKAAVATFQSKVRRQKFALYSLQ